MSKPKYQALILAGGQGSRLRPYTTVLPKPLVPVGEYPIAEILIRQLKDAGIKDILMATGYLSELIEAYFGKGSRWGVNIGYVREKKPLGTAGAFRLAKNLDDHVLVVNGDTLTDLNFRQLLKIHKAKKAAATITVKERIVRTDFGVVHCDDEGCLQHYIEKPEHRSLVSTGINVLNKKCRNLIKDGEAIGIPELMLRIKEADQKVYCYQTKARWFDLGRLEDLNQAGDIWQKNKSRFLRTKG